MNANTVRSILKKVPYGYEIAIMLEDGEIITGEYEGYRKGDKILPPSIKIDYGYVACKEIYSISV